MDETTQETPTANEPILKTENENQKNNQETKSSDHQTESKNEDSQSVDPNDEIIEDNANSVKSRSECSDRSRTDSEDDDASVILEREEGDGQESTPNRKVDDDEDKRNPQYIPKRGTFYEHDDRTAVEEGEEAEKPEDERATEKMDAANKKKIWSEKEGGKWNHDRFNDQEQAPKSRTELISTYGYDIRNEEGPPRARRRRRYGRGPNKYTRNWEDEEAYSKPTNVVAKLNPRKPRSKNQEEFPPLRGSRNQSKSSDRTDTSASGDTTDQHTVHEPVADEKEMQKDARQSDGGSTTSQSSAPVNGGEQKNEAKGSSENGEEPRLQRQQQQQREHQKEPVRRDNRENRNNRNTPRNRQDEHHHPPPQQQRSQGNNSRGITRTRGFRSGGRTADSNRSRNNKNQNQPQQQEEGYTDYIISQNYTNKSANQQQEQSQQQDLDKDVSNMNIQDSGYNSTRGGGKFGGGASTRQTSVPPRLQAEQRGSKRYSSIRQRSLPETAAPAFGQHTAYYQTEFGPQNQQQQNQSGLLPHPTPTIHSQVPANNTAQLITVAPTSQGIGTLPHPGPTANGAPPLMQAPPPQYAPPYAQAPPAFLPAGVPAPAFIPQQAPPPQIINYAQPPPQFTQATGYTNFQHQQFNPVNQSQPTELYQPQGGITYYSTQNQQIAPRIPHKRPKAAIPIVPPPEHKEPRGRGRLNQGPESPVGGTPETPVDIYIEQQQQQATDTTVPNNSLQYQNEAAVVVQQ